MLIKNHPKGFSSCQRAKAFLMIQALFFLLTNHESDAQNPWKKMAEMPASIDTALGFETVSTENFQLQLVRSSQTVSKLAANNDPGFDFTPGDRLAYRMMDGAYHLGDINFRLKSPSSGAWKDYSSAAKRAHVIPMSPSANQLAVANLQPTFPADLPLKVIRSWEDRDGDLVLRFSLQNISENDLEIGSLGIPMIFNNIISGKSLDEAHAENVFFDPYIGLDAGYLQVVRLHGKGPVLLVLPETNTGFEAYRPLNDDPTPRGITFEGFHEWMVHSKAYSTNEWSGASPWNSPTSRILAPGEQVEYAIKLTLTEDVTQIENKLLEEQQPVAVGVPGYVVPMDVNAKLFVHHAKPIASINVTPENALEVTQTGTTPNGWKEYSISGKVWGRSRLTITYEDDTKQTIHYKVIKSEEQVVEDLGSFLLNEQWFDEPKDPFHRNPSVISYDYEEKKQVAHDRRAWIAGLGDEAGSGSWLAAMMKASIQPNAEEIKKLNRFVQETLWGGIQFNEGPNKYGVKKSLYYYEPEQMPEGTYAADINYNTWSAWSKEHAESTERSYNYPHVTAAHWVMYRLARYHQDLVTDYSWEWYLENAFHTAVAMVEQAPHYAQFGQMEGTIFVMLLQDLKREGLSQFSAELEQVMKKRADLWKSLNYPFGSEMPWDSTGQEEVYLWSKYFGYDTKAAITLHAILAYMPTIPHWGYNGSARRYWDFLYGGKLTRVERQLHHYGSGLNAIPVLSEYRDHPDDFYLLRVGYGGLMGQIANITEEGFGPAAFHSYPSTLAIDAYSGDFGTGFLGYAVNTSAYMYQHDEFGWLGFGGNIEESGDDITLTLTTAAKTKVYLAPVGVLLTLDAGQFHSVTFNTRTQEIDVVLQAKNNFTKLAYLSISNSGESTTKTYVPEDEAPQNLGAYEIKLKNKTTRLTLVAK